MRHAPRHAPAARATRWLTACGAVLLLAACTTTVSGQGRRFGPGGASAGASGGASTATSGGAPGGAAGGSVPSGAPAPVSTRYPDASPEIRSYLYARDTTYSAGTLSITGTFTGAGGTVTVAGKFGFDNAASTSVGTCRLTVAGATAEIRGVGDSTWANGPAAFWTGFGKPAAAATAAAGRWVAVAEQVTGVAVCNNEVFFLGQFEPQSADDISTSVDTSSALGAQYLIEDATTGVTTVIDQDLGTIIGIRTKAGDLTVTYPGAPVTVAAPAGAVTVPGI